MPGALALPEAIEPVDPYSLALEYKLEYDMDDTGLVKQIDANREAADSLKEDLADIATFVKLIDLVKDKPFGYCNGVDDKSFVGNTLSGTFAMPKFRGNRSSIRHLSQSRKKIQSCIQNDKW